MASSSYLKLQVPNLDNVVTDTLLVTDTWHRFFLKLYELLNPLGEEKSFSLVNNQVAPSNISGLQFDSQRINHAIVEYLIQRVTTGGGATELIAAGIFHCVYKPSSGTWNIVLVGSPGPDASGVTFSITTNGQIQYTSSNITGTASISKITFRARTLGARVAT